MTFASPLLLLGLALASVPIIIHLLNRRRFMRVDWAPMRYLKLTIKANHRRLRIEQWLLLALRTLAIIALILAIAQPMIATTGLGAWLAGSARTSRVVVIDDSLSMGYRSGGGRAAFDRARDAAASLIGQIGSQDSLTLVTSTAADAPLIRHGHLDERESLLDRVAQLQLTQASNQWSAVLERVDEHLTEAPFTTREVTLITDAQAAGWSAEVAALTRRWSAAGVAVRIVDVSGPLEGNVALLDLSLDQPVAMVDQPVRLRATVRNDHAEALASPQAILTVDDASQPVVLADLPQGESVEIPLSVTFTEPGQHVVRLSLPDDPLQGDNRRWLVVDVRRSVEVLLVDGRPGLRPFESATDFLAVALAAGRSPWRVRQLVDSEWFDAPLTAPDVLVLANVGAIPAARAAELRAQVEAGMGLMIFAGDQVDPLAYNESLYQSGRGVLPARLEGTADGSAPGLIITAGADSPLASLGNLAPASLATIVPRRFARVALPSEAHDPVRVLAHWNDVEESPAVVEKRVGRGRVLLWTMSADRSWSDWPTEPSYVLAVREAGLALASRDTDAVGRITGEPLRMALDPDRPPARIALHAPGKDAALDLLPDHTSPAGPMLRHDATRLAGLYRVEWEEPGLTRQVRQFVFNPHPRESDLASLPQAQFDAWFEGIDLTVVRLGEDASLGAGAGPARELWRTLAFVLLITLAAESGLAAWIGRER